MRYGTCFLALADIHGNRESFEKIIECNRSVEGIFIAGDLTNFGNEAEAHAIMKMLKSLVNSKPIFFVAGNCDTQEARNVFQNDLSYVEQRCTPLRIENRAGCQANSDEIEIIGCGGGLYRSGATPFELKDEELERGLRQRIFSMSICSGASPCYSYPYTAFTHQC